MSGSKSKNQILPVNLRETDGGRNCRERREGADVPSRSPPHPCPLPSPEQGLRGRLAFSRAAERGCHPAPHSAPSGPARTGHGRPQRHVTHRRGGDLGSKVSPGPAKTGSLRARQPNSCGDLFPSPWAPGLQPPLGQAGCPPPRETPRAAASEQGAPPGGGWRGGH